jgi:C-terminal processing protease CtpA/Prc
LKTAGSDSGSDSLRRSRDEPSQSNQENLSKYLQNLFTDDNGTVQIKSCVLKKDPTYNGYGLLLRYQNGLHLIDQVEEDSPAYSAGLREDDVILFVDKKNVEQMTHDDVKNLIRKLSQSNTNIDLIIIKKTDIARYKAYQERNSINWDGIVQNKQSIETIQSRHIIYRKRSYYNN